MNITLNWLDGVAFQAETESNHTLIIDGPPEHGGQNRGARPMETFLSGAVACSAFDVVHILKKGKHPLAALSVRASAERATGEPKVFTAIRLHFIASGDGLKESAVERAVSLSVEKYCSALQMLSAVCEVSASWEIKTPAAGDAAP